MKEFGIGILGCGGVAHRWYLKGLAGQKEHYRLVAVCDHIPERAVQAAKTYDVPESYGSLEAMLDDPAVDLVVILTRHEDHVQHITKALDAGKHVYSEKPFASTTIEAKRLMALAKKKGLVLGCAPQVMLSSRNKRVKEILAKKELGKVLFIRGSNSNMGPHDRKGIDFDPTWFYEDGGSMSSLGIYGLATLLWWFGQPQRIAGFSGIAYPKREVKHGPFRGKHFTVHAPDNETLMLDFGAGVFALFDGSYTVLTPPKYEFEIHGTEASLFVGGFGGPESVILHRREEIPQAVGPDDDCHLRWNLSWGVESTIAAVKADKEPATSAELAYRTIEVMEAMKISSQENRMVCLR